MRCAICDSKIKVGKSGLCVYCRTAIAKAKNGCIPEDAEMRAEYEANEHRSMNFIDTSKADYYSRVMVQEGKNERADS